jgi:4-amino-4-deoxychorismate lyase
MRRVVLETAAAAGIVAEECDLTLGDLRSAAELFMTNSLFGIWPVAQLDEQQFPTGTITRRLMQRLEIGTDA